jgi:hypothetical protein
LKRVALVLVVFLSSLSFFSCSSYNSSVYKPPSGLTTRVLASQGASTPTALPGLLIINGMLDTLAIGGISAGSSPGLMAISPNRTTVLSLDTVTNGVVVVNARTEATTGSVQLPGPTTSMVAPGTNYGYAAVPSAPIGSAPGAVIVMNIAGGGVFATVAVPSAQTLVPSPDGSQFLVFSNDSNALTIFYPLLVNTASPVTVAVPGFDRPVYGVFSSDGSTAYILNCGPECGSRSASASVQVLDMATLTLVGNPVPVDGATIGWLSGSTLYVAGNSPTNGSCASETTAATTCGRLDAVDLGSMTVTNSVVITDGYHDRIDMSINGQLFIGSYNCTTIGNVNNPQGEVRGCLSIFDTTKAGNTTAVVPPDNGDVTGLQSFTSRDVEYVAEGGNLRVYDTTKDILLITSYISTGTIEITGNIIDVKAVDFF